VVAESGCESVTVTALPDHRTLLTALRGELDPALAPGGPERPHEARPQQFGPAPIQGTVPLPGQAPVLKPRISMKQRRP